MKKVKAIILAAGVGSRLEDITKYKPKTLIEVNGKPILSYIIDSLIENGIKNIIICVGYLGNMIISFCKKRYPSSDFTFVRNTEYENTNNMYTFYLTTKYIEDEDLLLMNADLVFDPSIIADLLKSDSTCVAVEKGIYKEESMKITVSNGLIKGISKQITAENAFGCSIDIYFIKSIDIPVVKNEIKLFIEEKKDYKQWTEVLLDYMFQTGILRATPYNIKDRKWYEIDTIEDLINAELLFNEKVSILKNKSLFIIDKDGTLMVGNSSIIQTKDFFDILNQKSISYVVLTNNSSKSNNEHTDSFNNSGIEINKDNIFSSLDCFVSYSKKMGIKNIFWIATNKVSDYLQEKEFIFNDTDPEALLLTYSPEITYTEISTFNLFLNRNTLYFATHCDKVCPTETGNIPDIGSFIALLEASSGRLPDMYFGKPEKMIVDMLLQKLNKVIDNTVIIGDRLYTDIKLAHNCNIFSILVLSGETTRADYEFSPIKADIVLKNINSITKLLQNTQI